MMKCVKTLLFGLFILVAFSGCDVAKQLGGQVEGAYNMVQCKYDYSSVSNLSIGGIDLSKGLSLTAIPTITSLLSGTASSLPLSFNVNMNVSNPNASTALMNGLEYVISIDNVQFTTGAVNQSLSIPSGGSSVLPLTIGVDLITLMKSDSRDAVVNIVKNFIGMGNQKSNVSLQIKPTFMIGNYPVTSPVYIPINFAFGGKQ